MLSFFRSVFQRKISNAVGLKGRSLLSVNGGKRMFQAGATERITSPWNISNAPINDLLYTYLTNIRLRSAEQYFNNGYAKKAVNLFKSNVVGKNGIRLQCRFKKDGTLLRDMNAKIERAFERWGEHESCDVSGALSWVEIQQLVILQIVRDGEAIVRMVKGVNNSFGFALQVIEPELLDIGLNREKTLKENRIVLGVELDEWSKPIAYYFKTEQRSFASVEHQRIPASEILHLFVREKTGQRRGIPWLHAGLRELHMLHGYSDAELTAARVSAAKMGFFTQSGSGKYTGDEIDDNGNLITDAQPGSFETLPAGVDFKAFDPQHPTSNFQPFLKAMLRGIASGIGVSYTSLANDLESVNFSSIRSSLIEERDAYMILQDWLIEYLTKPVYRNWLQMASLKKAIPVKLDELDEYDTPNWLPRRWAWVDPLKDVKANVEAINAKIKSRTEVCAEQGRDLEDVLSEHAQEQLIAKENGLEFEDELTGESKDYADDDAQ